MPHILINYTTLEQRAEIGKFVNILGISTIVGVSITIEDAEAIRIYEGAPEKVVPQAQTRFAETATPAAAEKKVKKAKKEAVEATPVVLGVPVVPAAADTAAKMSLDELQAAVAPGGTTYRDLKQLVVELSMVDHQRVRNILQVYSVKTAKELPITFWDDCARRLREEVVARMENAGHLA